ncbi:MAG: carbamoyltransferase HypF [Bacteroidetes bacterium]|nr:carbamoyltransferase HypF [Bacteroidota bacterium]MCW5896167.1 carbamoyltransferase HypF [Bacteroidota bacterium]
MHIANMTRLRVAIHGAVQGVGFRPFIYRLASDCHLNGWIENSPQGVCIEVEGGKESLERFLLRVVSEKPVHSSIQSLEATYLDPAGYSGFEIQSSNHAGKQTALVLPDIATCPDCLREMLDPLNRRYLYPFINCTHCGPRFSIIQSLPYDRVNTTMKQFEMCDECRHEYENPQDRRFHAQPIGCPQCGPRIELWAQTGTILSRGQEALTTAATSIQQGMIVALKGLGGFHLLVDAGNEDAVVKLRYRKRREAKPLAVMFPSLSEIETACEVSALERQALQSPEAPIVLLRKRSESTSRVAPSVSPANPYIGAMLPYTPLHHLVMQKCSIPLVATSGNVSDEPICIDENEALQRLHGIADVFLVHNRPIQRHVDDSVVRVMLGREQVLRRARGYAPLPIRLKYDVPTMMALGAHQKNTVSVSTGRSVFISQHIGDLETPEAFNAFTNVAADLRGLLAISPELIATDMHPDYLSTQHAQSIGLPITQVQHHIAHVAACMAENELDDNVLGVSWDGTGLGCDGTIWGGEFFLVHGSEFTRVATFREFCLPGGSQAVREPRRTAIGLMHTMLGDDVFIMKDLLPVSAFTHTDLRLLQRVMVQGVNSPRTTSVGRLFDAVASIVNLAHKVSYEGQAAVALEYAIDDHENQSFYEYHIETKQSEPLLFSIDWAPMIVGIIHDVNSEIPISCISAKFHNTLVEMIVGVARLQGAQRIALTGGCFQNKYLTERAVKRLREEGFTPYWHQRIPPNDGGISLGQIAFAARMEASAKNMHDHDLLHSSFVLIPSDN